MSSHIPPVWTDERIREAFIYDGGEAAYHDPISGARTHRKVAGDIFDVWLAAHDAAVRDALSTPPADDVREAFADAIEEEHNGWVTEGGCGFEGWTRGYGPGASVRVSAAIDRILASPGFAVVRPRGTVADAEVKDLPGFDGTIDALNALSIRGGQPL